MFCIVITDEMIPRVEVLIMQDLHIKLNEIAKECTVSHGSVSTRSLVYLNLLPEGYLRISVCKINISGVKL